MEDADCKDIVEIVTEYLEGTLSDRERLRFEKHLHECDGCDRYLTQLDHVRTVLGKVDLGRLSCDERVRFIATFRAWKVKKAS